LDENAGGETWNMISNRGQTLKGSAVGEPLQGSMHVNVLLPGLSLRSNPGLKLANAFGVKTWAQLANRLQVEMIKSQTD